MEVPLDLTKRFGYVSKCEIKKTKVVFWFGPTHFGPVPNLFGPIEHIMFQLPLYSSSNIEQACHEGLPGFGCQNQAGCPLVLYQPGLAISEFLLPNDEFLFLPFYQQLLIRGLYIHLWAHKVHCH